jgi:hypothetical protein
LEEEMRSIKVAIYHCPFCNERPRIHTSGFENRNWSVYCKNSNCYPHPEAVSGTRESAIKLWNTGLSFAGNSADYPNGTYTSPNSSLRRLQKRKEVKKQ